MKAKNLNFFPEPGTKGQKVDNCLYFKTLTADNRNIWCFHLFFQAYFTLVKVSLSFLLHNVYLLNKLKVFFQCNQEKCSQKQEHFLRHQGFKQKSASCFCSYNVHICIYKYLHPKQQSYTYSC